MFSEWKNSYAAGGATGETEERKGIFGGIGNLPTDSHQYGSSMGLDIAEGV